MSVFALHPPESSEYSELRVSRFRGSPDTSLLAVESERVLRVTVTALKEPLRIIPAKYSSSREKNVRATPALTLQLFPHPGRRQVVGVERAQVLSAFALLIAHSRRLDAVPQLKRAFWLDVLRSHATFETTYGVPKTALRDPAFPIFAIDARDHTYSYLSDSPTPYESLEDMLVSFLTTPPMLELTADNQEHARLAVELCFADKRPTSVSALEALERTLDRTFAHPTRQFTVSTLDLSGNRMNPEELAVVARIAHKCRYVYHVAELRLNAIMPPGGTSGYRAPAETPREFLDIMRAAYGFARPPVLTTADMGILTNEL